jgi:hypothetical protein
MVRRAARLIVLAILVLTAMATSLVAWHFPFATDDPVRREEALQEFYITRPYEDFGIRGRIVKASIPIRSLREFRLVTALPNRMIRSVVSTWGTDSIALSPAHPELSRVLAGRQRCREHVG